MGAQPDTLYLYNTSMHAAGNVLESIYDGPIDTNGFDYQPVILEKLPSLSNGDAVLQSIQITAGDLVVNDAGDVVELSIGDKVRPFGCNQPDCAIEWDGDSLEMAQLSATFTLLDGIKWSDGEPLTANDSVFSYHLALDCGYPWGEEWGPCGGLGDGGYETLSRTAAYNILDNLTNQWVGLPGYLDPYYFTNFAHPLPEHQLRGYSPEDLFELDDASRHPIGWGAYRITYWEYGNEIRLEKNPFYFRSGEGLPAFDELIFRFVEQNESNDNLLLSGACDMLELEAASQIPHTRLLELNAAGHLQAHFTTTNVWEHADFNIRPVPEIINGGEFSGWDLDGDGQGPFGDVRLRQAIAMCMDRQRVIDEVLLGQSPILDSYVPPGHPLYNPDAPHYDYDVTAASALLDEIGWIDTDGDGVREAHNVTGVPDGTALRFKYETTTSITRQQGTQILAEGLARCGIQVALNYMDASEWYADGPEGELFGRRFDMGEFASWITGANPLCEFYTTWNIPGPPEELDTQGNHLHALGWSGQNVTGYSHPEYDQVCQTAKGTLPGQPGYIENHLSAQEIFTHYLPAIPLYLRNWVTAARADMCGHIMDPTAGTDTWNIEEYDYGEGCE
jgi:peptide/nickel transport system substrate-binding protein